MRSRLLPTITLPLLGLVLALLVGLVAFGPTLFALGGEEAPAPSREKAPAAPDPASLIPGYARLSPAVARGAQPEGDAAFAALAAAGIKTLVSVDGASPDVETARRHGLRYIHVPFGYDGIPEDSLAVLVKACQVAQAAGPVFVHCHHGRHRGPAGCAVARIVIDGVSPEEAVKDLTVAGTDPKYKGLYESVRSFRMPSKAALDAVPADLPSVAPVPDLQRAMVEIDAKWDRIKAVRKASWAAPADHPDVDPPHEATILAEYLRELARRPDVAEKPEAFRKHLGDAEAFAWALSKALAKGTADPGAASTAFDGTLAACTACHAEFRDNTHRAR